jgi:outer membrane putative beta-barrel porin/alpha-amylase
MRLLRNNAIRLLMIGAAIPLWSLSILPILRTSASVAESCPRSTDPIATDRPDVANSSIVVPTGSLQSEDGVNLSGRRAARIFDGTNTRLRVGVAPCLEFLVDLPTYSAAARGTMNSGFSNVVPAIKWQFSPTPGQFDLSATLGIGLPTGATSITGHGVQPYLQFPWSYELSGDWGISGMLTFFTFPADPVNRLTTESNFVLEKKVSERGALFVELVSDYPDHAGPSLLLNSGGYYRLTPTEQIDFHLGFGLNHNAPNYTVGFGYSFRLDGLFGRTG